MLTLATTAMKFGVNTNVNYVPPKPPTVVPKPTKTNVSKPTKTILYQNQQFFQNQQTIITCHAFLEVRSD